MIYYFIILYQRAAAAAFVSLAITRSTNFEKYSFQVIKSSSICIEIELWPLEMLLDTPPNEVNAAKDLDLDIPLLELRLKLRYVEGL
mmetsp:Transcript_13512/g.19931  ORF Transcript_13512/g.19931 Transcript_13512/m.19931 type:complete len:87 (+) Transcript_13512:1-261(+)